MDVERVLPAFCTVFPLSSVAETIVVCVGGWSLKEFIYNKYYT
jgi:hypothetical protein